MKNLLHALVAFALVSFAQAGTKSLTAPVDDAHSSGGPSAEELAKIAQNPVGNLISVPVQWNMGFGAGPTKTDQQLANCREQPRCRTRRYDVHSFPFARKAR